MTVVGSVVREENGCEKSALSSATLMMMTATNGSMKILSMTSSVTVVMNRSAALARHA